MKAYTFCTFAREWRQLQRGCKIHSGVAKVFRRFLFNGLACKPIRDPFSNNEVRELSEGLRFSQKIETLEQLKECTVDHDEAILWWFLYERAKVDQGKTLRKLVRDVRWGIVMLVGPIVIVMIVLVGLAVTLSLGLYEILRN